MVDRKRDFVMINGQQYCVDTCHTFDKGWETMVFKSKNNQIISFHDVYVKHWVTMFQAMCGHDDVVRDLAKYLGGKL